MHNCPWPIHQPPYWALADHTCNYMHDLTTALGLFLVLREDYFLAPLRIE
ncbi:hypothetical protein DsansV1_C13g0124051 [Dioscorea sansibarensis]